MISQHSMNWTEAQKKLVFDAFDKDKSGQIDYEEFLVTLRGELNERRKQLALMAFEVFLPSSSYSHYLPLSLSLSLFVSISLSLLHSSLFNYLVDEKILDADKSGVVDIEDIRAKYNAKKHPDVIAGKRTEDSVLL